MEEILKGLIDKQPHELTGEPKKLFEAIMKIADERDELKKENEELKIYKERCNGAIEFINSREENMIPEHYEDLHYILCESEEGEW